MAYYIHLQERYHVIYIDILYKYISRHKEFRPKLLRYLKMKKLERHKKVISVLIVILINFLIIGAVSLCSI